MKKLSIIIMLLGLNVYAADDYSSEVTFNKDVKQIFTNNCTQCHPGISNYQVAYAQREKILKKVTARYDKQMPPKYTSVKLSTAEVNLIKEWIKTGAKQ